MAAARAPRWGVHHAIGDSIFTEGQYQTRSSFVVRGRSRIEAMEAARKHPRIGRFKFVVRRLAK